MHNTGQFNRNGRLAMCVRRETAPDGASVTATRSIRQKRFGEVGPPGQKRLRRQQEAAGLAAVTDSSAAPSRSPRRVFTSTKTSTSPSRMIRSSSPDGQRQFAATNGYPVFQMAARQALAGCAESLAGGLGHGPGSHAATGAKQRRWCGQGPCSANRALCSSEQ